jgi:glutathione S-transferase
MKLRQVELYQFASSPFSEKVRRALHYKRVDYTIVEVERAAVSEGRYAHVSASGKFPALLIDGQAIQDSTDILEHLDLVFPSRPILPAVAAERALAHVLEDWADESLYFYEMTARLAWPHNLDATLDQFTAGFPNMSRDAVREMILSKVGELTRAQGIGRKTNASVIADLERHFQSLEQMLQVRSWLATDHPSNADFAVAAQVSAILFAEEGRSILSRCPAVARWLQRLEEEAPAVRLAN